MVFMYYIYLQLFKYSDGWIYQNSHEIELHQVIATTPLY